MIYPNHLQNMKQLVERARSASEFAELQREDGFPKSGGGGSTSDGFYARIQGVSQDGSFTVQEVVPGASAPLTWTDKTDTEPEVAFEANQWRVMPVRRNGQPVIALVRRVVNSSGGLTNVFEMPLPGQGPTFFLPQVTSLDPMNPDAVEIFSWDYLRVV